MIYVTKLIARCRMLLLLKSTLLPFTLLHVSAYSLIRTFKSFKFKNLALQLLLASLLLKLLLHPTPLLQPMNKFRARKVKITRRVTRNTTSLPIRLGCTEPPILILRRRSSCKRDAALFVSKLVTELLSVLRSKSNSLVSMKSQLLLLFKDMKIWEKTSL